MASSDPREVALRRGLITPRRTVSVTFDHTDTVATEPYFHHHREGRQMLPADVAGCIRLQAGIWQLLPINDWGTGHESEIGQSFVIRLSEWVAGGAAASLTEVPHQRKLTELTGVTPSPDVAVSGDYFLTRRVTAAGAWNDSLPNADIPEKITESNLYPLSFMGRTVTLHTGLTGYAIKAYNPGAPLQTKDVIIGFKFGGLLRAEGYGLFFLALGGDGTATLYEKFKPEGYSSIVWVEQAKWRYLAPAESPGGAFGLWILPFTPAGIEFDTYTGGGGQDYFKVLTDRNLDILSGVNATQGAHQSYVFTASRGELGAFSGTQQFAVTGHGQPELYIREESRPLVQIARLGYDALGVITDKPIQLPHYAASDEHLLRLTIHGKGVDTNADGTLEATFQGELQNADGGAPLIEFVEEQVWRGETINWDGFTPPLDDKNAIQAEITLTSEENEAGERWWTPYVAGYSVVRNGHRQSYAPGAKTGGATVGISCSGVSYDPEQETAAIAIEDLKDELTFLRSRGKASVRIATTYDEAGTESAETSIIFEGYTGRATAMLKGRDAAVYPSDDWRRLEIECEGKWHRLTEKFFHNRIPFDDDSTSPDGALNTPGGETKPWKITTIIRHLLQISGFDEDQLDIPDLDLRLFLRIDQKPDGIYFLQPGISVAAFLTMLCRDYINGFLYWEPNAGTKGMWRLKQPPDGTETPVWTFTLDRPTGTKLAHMAVAYGSSTSPILGPPERFPFESWVVAPEGNCLTVSGGWDQKTGERFQQSIVNEESFNAPLHPATADVTNLDHISSGVVPIEYVDTTLDSQQAVDYIARRVFNLACRGRKFLRFTAEYVLVDRADVEPTIFTTHPVTPLRPGDIVRVTDQDGNHVTHILHQCSPSFENQGVMLATYELELFRPETTFARVGDLGLPKEINRRESKRALGAAPWTPNLLSPGARRADLESEILALPVKPADPIRNGSTWVAMVGHSTVGGDDEVA